jgi:hypothetical protein
MEVEALRGFLAKHPGPCVLSMADGSSVHVASPKFMLFPPEEVRDPRTLVVYSPSGQFKLLDVLMVVTAGPASPNGVNGH